MIKVSAVIPVYNVEPYLKRCLDSITNQTLKDIEIICIEDCSTDNSLEILQKYAQIDARIKILKNQKNMGQSYSRNRGIKESKGKYIQFVDSDDYMNLDAFETLFYISEKNNLDVLAYNIEYKGNRYGTLNNKNVSFENLLLNGREFYYSLNSKFGVYACNMFLLSEFLKKNNLYFHNGIYHEDEPFTFSIFYYAENCMYVNEVFYNYFIRENSTMTMKKNEKHIKGILHGIIDIMKYPSLNDIAFETAKYTKINSCMKAAVDIILKGQIDVSDIIFEKELDSLLKFILSQQLIDIILLIKKLPEIKLFDNIIVYGAGKAAEELINIFNSLNLKISYVTVSETKNNNEFFYGYKIYSLNELEIEKNSTVFLCAVKRYFPEIKNNLLKSGYTNIINICKED